MRTFTFSFTVRHEGDVSTQVKVLPEELTVHLRSYG